MIIDEIHAILRAPRKTLLALAAIAIGGGSFGLVLRPDGTVYAELSECRLIVGEQAERVVELEEARERVLTNLRPLQPRDNPFERHSE